MNNYETLEFDKILMMLADCAVSDEAKERCLSLKPADNSYEAGVMLEETTQAKRIIELLGSPPIAAMTGLKTVIELAGIEAMLIPEQITAVLIFLTSCKRLKSYLKRAEASGIGVAAYGKAVDEIPELSVELERCIKNGQVDDMASPILREIRKKIMILTEQVKSRLDSMLKKNTVWYSDSFVVQRNGRYTLPVKKEHKHNVPGTIVDISNTGGTCFIEPEAVSKIRAEIYELEIAEDNEVRRILYDLTCKINERLPVLKMNMEAMETLDFLFAKAKLSINMNCSAPEIVDDKIMLVKNGRHPLINRETAIPLDLIIDGETSGVVITGPNTGGKTVALKTVGLLSLMSQSGMHIPADSSSRFGIRNNVLCDVGDGQSISENLSTFSSHMKNIIDILRTADEGSLVLLDELGSGTDPAEGMGLAVSVLEELSEKGCLFIATTHYPQIKEYAAKKSGITNARMAFDRENLTPLYRLELGEAGESCALYIAEKLGLPAHMLDRARQASSGELDSIINGSQKQIHGNKINTFAKNTRQVKNGQDKAPETGNSEITTDLNVLDHKSRFQIGDSVKIYPQKDIGIVYATSNDKGEIGVQVKGVKKLINHKRLKQYISAKELYPDDYDFSIVFDSVEERKAHHVMEKRHVEGLVIRKDSISD